MVKHNGRIGRVCPVVRQQCQLARGCVLFDEAVSDVKDLDDKARAWACPKRGAYIFPDELKVRRFDTQKHPDAKRVKAGLAMRSFVHAQRRRRDQLALPLADEVAAAAATQ